MSRTWEIYQIICLKRGKSYIGLTNRGVGRRWKEHIYNAFVGNCDFLLSRAIRKYPESSFVVEVLERKCSFDEAVAAERFWIANCGTTVPLGYNSTTGGDGTDGCELVGRKRSPETCAKISIVMKGKKKSEAHRKAMSVSRKLAISNSLKLRVHLAEMQRRSRLS